MACLLRREELEYALEDDEEVFAAMATSRWDNPEVTAMFADTIRRQKLLMATKMSFLSHASFRLDLQAIAAAKPEDFVQLQRYATLGQAYASSADKVTRGQILVLWFDMCCLSRHQVSMFVLPYFQISVCFDMSPRQSIFF